jgi:hypothetical protein
VLMLYVQPWKFQFVNKEQIILECLYILQRYTLLPEGL